MKDPLTWFKNDPGWYVAMYGYEPAGIGLLRKGSR